MSKIAKYIKLALHNSSAAEAATALKMAAAAMTKEGVNPADYLQEKGGSDDSARVQALEDKIASLNRSISSKDQEITSLRAQLKQAQSSNGNSTASTRALQRQIEDLEDQALLFRRELREAKELAIKWCKEAQQKDAEIKELSRSAVMSAAKAEALEKEARSLGRKNQLFAYAGVICTIAAFLIGGNNATETANSYKDQVMGLNADLYKRDSQITNLENEISRLNRELEAKSKAPVAPVVAPKPIKRPEVTKYTIDSICKAVGGSDLFVTFNVNTRTSTVTEPTDHLPDGYSVSLPSTGAPGVGHKYTLTYSDGTKIPCEVTSVY